MENQEVRYFLICDGALPEAPVQVSGFNADQDMLVLAGAGFSRDDIQFVQQNADTLVLCRNTGQELAVILHTNAFDLDPTPLLRSFYEALAANRFEAIQHFLAEDILWETGGPTDILPWAGSWQGHAEVEELFHLLNKSLACDELVPTRFIAQGNTVATVLDGKVRLENGREISGGVVHWATVKNGKISNLQCYRDTFPIVEAVLGGRPFTVWDTRAGWHDHVVHPVPALRKTDSIVFEPPNMATPNATASAVMAMYGALQKLDLTEMRRVFTADVIWHMFGPPDLIAWSGKWIGPEAALASARHIIETMHFEQFKAIRMICQGNTTAVVIDEPGSSKATGLPFHTSVAHIVTVNPEGKISHFTNYVDTTGIVEAFLGGRPFEVMG